MKANSIVPDINPARPEVTTAGAPMVWPQTLSGFGESAHFNTVDDVQEAVKHQSLPIRTELVKSAAPKFDPISVTEV